jgi:hypothetical protein
MDTVQALRKELADRRGIWREICAATGLSYWWLTKFAQGRIGEPGLSKIEALQAYMRANPVAHHEGAVSDGGSPNPTLAQPQHLTAAKAARAA